MRYLGALLVVVLAIAGAVALLAMRTERGVHCPEPVVILRGRGSAPLECICVDGQLATCFPPGP